MLKEGNTDGKTDFSSWGIWWYTIGICDSRKFGVADSSKLEEEIGSKEGVLFYVYELDDEGIPEGNILGTALVNDE